MAAALLQVAVVSFCVLSNFLGAGSCRSLRAAVGSKGGWLSLRGPNYLTFNQVTPCNRFSETCTVGASIEC